MEAASSVNPKVNSDEAEEPELPLLDELQLLIAKEKAVLEYQVLLQETEAKKWQAKYDALIREIESAGKQREGGVNAAQLQALIEAQDKQFQPTDVLEAMLLKQEENLLTTTTFDCSGIKLDKPALHRMIKHAKLFPRLKVLQLTNCGLHDGLAPELLLLMQLPLDHVDMSDNELGAAGGIALVEGMQQARHTPATMMLHGNRVLATSKSFLEAFLDFCVRLAPVVIQHFSISLQDWREMPSRTASSTATDDDFDTIYAIDKQPLLAQSLVSALIHGHTPGASRQQRSRSNSAKPARATSSSTITTTSKHAPSQAARPSSSSRLARTKPSFPAATTPPGAANSKQTRTPKSLPLLSLTSLALRDAYLSKDTMESLSRLASAPTRSLTALDLKWSFCGNAGARALAKAIKNSTCSLIQLRLAGCSVEFRGVQALADALQTNRSLTLLDLRRNTPTDEGAHALVQAMRHSKVLKHLDLRGCPLSIFALRMCTEESAAQHATILTDGSIDCASCLQPWSGIRLQHGVAVHEGEREKELEVFTVPSRVLYELLPELSTKSIVQLSWQWKLRTRSHEEVLWSVRVQNRGHKSLRHLWRQAAETSAASELSTLACALDCACIPHSDDTVICVYACAISSTPLWNGSNPRHPCSLLAGNVHAEIVSLTGDICLHDDNELLHTATSATTSNTIHATWLSGGFTDMGGQPLAIFEQQQHQNIGNFAELPGSGWTLARQIAASVPGGLEHSPWRATIKLQCRIAFRDDGATSVHADHGYDWAVLALELSADADIDDAKIVAQGSSYERASTIHAFLWQQHAATFSITSDTLLFLVVRPIAAAVEEAAFVLVRNCAVWLRREDIEEETK